MLKSKLFQYLLQGVALVFLFAACHNEASVSKENLALIPYPNQVKITEGVFASKAVLIEAGDFKNEAELFTPKLQRYLNISESNSVGEIELIKNEDFQREAYVLRVEAGKIEITAGGKVGIVYGFTTLLQLLDQFVKEEIEIPCLEIQDEPQYSWRGMHLDVSRHFYEVDFIKKMLDGMALNKLNVFHWHLTDDQGWRIEIKKHSLLTEKGAWREETILNHMANHPKKYDGKRYGGFYTQEQIKEVVAYADELGIVVVPEIEMPGHAVAAARAYPQLTCTGKPKPFNEWGVSDDVFCAGNEATFALLQDVIDEVVELFPSEYIHVGGDECPKDKWEQCPKCQKRMKQEGLKDEMGLQSYFIQRMERYINSKDKKLIGWDEILEGGLAENATVMSWRGVASGIEAASHGHDVVICPNAEVYLDHYQSNYNEPLAIAGLTTMESIYHWSPMPDGLSEEFRHHVLGAQGNIWTEYMPNHRNVEYMAYPRLCALAEMLWTQDYVQDFESFTNRMNHHYKRLDELDVQYRIPYPENLLPVDVLTQQNNKVTLTVPIADAVIYYTLDESCPKEQGVKYVDPIVFSEKQPSELVLKCVVQMPNGRWSAVHTSRIFISEAIESVDVDVQEGAGYKLIKGEFESANVDFSKVGQVEIQKGIHISENAPSQFYAEEISGFIKVPESGIYTFKLDSSDGSILFIHGREIINNDGFMYGSAREGRIALKAGLHPFEIMHLQAKYGNYLSLSAITPIGQLISFGNENVYH